MTGIFIEDNYCAHAECMALVRGEHSLCPLHRGAKRKCKVQDCDKWRRRGTLCSEHSGTPSKLPCIEEECLKKRWRGKYCFRHMDPMLKHTGVSSRTSTKSKGPRKPRRCPVPECRGRERVQGLCTAHAREQKLICVNIDNGVACTRKRAQNSKLCQRCMTKGCE